MNETTTEVEKTEEWKNLTPQDEETEIEPLRERFFACYRNQGLRPDPFTKPPLHPRHQDDRRYQPNRADRRRMRRGY